MTITNVTNNMATLIYPELSYRLVGVLFKVHTDLGPSYTEKRYQKAIEIQLRNSKISFEREKKISLPYENDQIGQFYADFIIEDKITLEMNYPATSCEVSQRGKVQFIPRSFPPSFAQSFGGFPAHCLTSELAPRY